MASVTYDDILNIIYLSSFCQIGVVARIYLGKLFGGSCTPGYDGSWDLGVDSLRDITGEGA